MGVIFFQEQISGNGVQLDLYCLELNKAKIVVNMILDSRPCYYRVVILSHFPNFLFYATF